MLLWFGDGITNFSDILMNGLSISPDEAPHRLHNGEAGIHFSDMCSYATDRCYTSVELNTGLVLLCDLCQVALNDKRLRTFKGKISPDSSTYIQLNSRCVVPCGKGIQMRDIYANERYNEYVAYEPSQIKMEYLVQLTFIHQSLQKMSW
eukprot:120959_1